MDDFTTQALTRVCFTQWMEVEGLRHPISVEVSFSLEADLNELQERTPLELSGERLAKMRHESTNYEFVLKSLREKREWTEARSGEIKYKYNNILRKLWIDKAIPVLKEHQRFLARERERSEAIHREETERQESIYRQEEAIRRAERERQEANFREEEARRQSEAKVLNQLREEKLRDARFAFNVQQIQDVIFDNHPTWARTRGNSSNVLWTGVLCNKNMMLFQCAVFDDPSLNRGLNSVGCKEYTVKNQNLGSFSSVTLVKRDAPLAQKLLQCNEIGAMITIASRDLVVVNIGGGKFPNEQSWDGLLSAIQTILSERERQKEEKALKQKQQSEQYILSEKLRQEKEHKERLLHEKERDDRAFIEKQTADLTSLQGARQALRELEKAHQTKIILIPILRERATFLRFCFQKSQSIAASHSSDGSGAGAIIGGIIGLIAGPFGAIVGAGIGAAIGGSNAEPSEQKQWEILLKDLDDFLKNLR